MSHPNIALIQFESVPLQPTINLSHVTKLITTAASQGADLVVLPEYFLTAPLTSFHIRFDPNLIHEEGHYLSHFQTLARDLSIDIVPGTIIERMKSTDSVFRNTSYYIDYQGRVLGRYHKVHLMNWEKEFLIPGTGRQRERVVATRWGKVLLLAGWDLMFPESIRSSLHSGLRDPPLPVIDLAICPALWGADSMLPDLTYDAARIDALCLSRVYENNIALLFCNAASEADERHLLSASGGTMWRHLGRSQVCLPIRGVVGRCENSESKVLIVKAVEMELLEVAKTIWGVREDSKRNSVGSF